MSDMNCRVKRIGLRVVLLWGILGLTMLLPATVSAGDYTVKVLPPNGVDDTDNIQSALNECVAHSPGCTVQLDAGTYFTRQLVTYNFNGNFEGMGKNRTTIEAIHFLPVFTRHIPTDGGCAPNLTDCLWPSLIIFVDGDIHVSDLSVKITAPPGTATAGWYILDSKVTDLLDAFRFMGQHPTYVTIDRIAVEGLPDDSPTSYGVNVINSAIYAGELARSQTPFDYYPMSGGTLTVRNSSFKSVFDGVGQGGSLKDISVTIGGSPSTGNVFENVNVGIDLESSENSVVEVSYNTSSGNWYGMWVLDVWPAFAPSKPSQYSIHDNKFTTTGSNAGGIYLWNDPENPWIRAKIYNNTVEPKRGTLAEGIGAYNTQGTVIWNNKIRGSGADAIGLWGCTSCTVSNNNLGGFTAHPSLAQIYLDPKTSDDSVVCSNHNDTVLDQGTGNTAMGCQP